MKRLFIAIKVDNSERLNSLAARLKKELAGERIRWVDPGNIHITLAFLGDTEESDIIKITGLMDHVSKVIPSFKLELKGIGLFRNARDPRVIWAGTEKNLNLDLLYEKLVEKLAGSALYSAPGVFNPHITLGRIKAVTDRQRLGTIVSDCRSSPIHEQEVKEIILYESILRPGGPVYNALHRSSLKN